MTGTSESGTSSLRLVGGVAQKGFSRGIEISVLFWEEKMFEPIVMLPDYCFSQEEIDKRLKKNDF
jgi:hypothetical protein